jgi:hypothetical protein
MISVVVDVPGGNANVASARKKLFVPPPVAGARPASVEVTSGKVTSVPVLDSKSRVAAV